VYNNVTRKKCVNFFIFLFNFFLKIIYLNLLLTNDQDLTCTNKLMTYAHRYNTCRAECIAYMPHGKDMIMSSALIYTSRGPA
jgi:hypothetical protein